MVDDGAYLGNIQITGLGSRYFKKTSKLYVRAQAYVVENKTKIYGKYSIPKKMKIKK